MICFSWFGWAWFGLLLLTLLTSFLGGRFTELLQNYAESLGNKEFITFVYFFKTLIKVNIIIFKFVLHHFVLEFVKKQENNSEQKKPQK